MCRWECGHVACVGYMSAHALASMHTQIHVCCIHPCEYWLLHVCIMSEHFFVLVMSFHVHMVLFFDRQLIMPFYIVFFIMNICITWLILVVRTGVAKKKIVEISCHLPEVWSSAGQ